MIAFDDALSLIAKSARPLGRERVPLSQAHGRVLASEVRAQVDAPTCDVSAMDGYAIRDADLASLPARLRVAGESFAGQASVEPVGVGECIRLFTGAPMPAGSDRVIIQEAVTREGDMACFAEPFGEARHVRRRGSDFAAGDLLVNAGRQLDGRALVAAAAADVDHVEVFSRARVIVLATGDELVSPGEAAGRSGALPDSISFGVAALISDWGGEIALCRRLRDDLEEMRSAAAEALNAADLVVVTGGASVGERDFAKSMFNGLELVFSKVAIKPGKPVWFGRAGGRLIIGLPGNPTSAMVTGRLLLAPLLAGLSGRAPMEALRWRRAPLAEALGPCGGRETFIRARYEGESARPLPNQDSSSQKTLVDADLLIRRRPGAPAAAEREAVEILEF